MARLALQDRPKDTTAVFAALHTAMGTNSSSPVSVRTRSSAAWGRRAVVGQFTRDARTPSRTQKAIWRHTITRRRDWQGRAAVFFGCQKKEGPPKNSRLQPRWQGPDNWPFGWDEKKKKRNKVERKLGVRRWHSGCPKSCSKAAVSTRREDSDDVKPTTFRPSRVVRTDPAEHHLM